MAKPPPCLCRENLMNLHLMQVCKLRLTARGLGLVTEAAQKGSMGLLIFLNPEAWAGWSMKGAALERSAVSPPMPALDLGSPSALLSLSHLCVCPPPDSHPPTLEVPEEGGSGVYVEGAWCPDAPSWPPGMILVPSRGPFLLPPEPQAPSSPTSWPVLPLPAAHSSLRPLATPQPPASCRPRLSSIHPR